MKSDKCVLRAAVDDLNVYEMIPCTEVGRKIASAILLHKYFFFRNFKKLKDYCTFTF